MGPGWLARHVQSAEQYQADIDGLPGQGFRLLDLNAYSINGVEHFATVWEQSPGPPWLARHDQTSEAHSGLFETLPAEGFRPVAVSGYDKAGEARFSSLWVQADGPEWRARHDMTGEDLQAEFDSLSPDFRPVDVCGYAVPGGARFAAVWESSRVGEWAARHGLTGAEYQQSFEHFRNHGLRPLRVSGYDAGGQLRFAAIWVRDAPLTWFSRHALPAPSYQSEFESIVGRGFRLAKVNGFSSAGQTSYSTVWHKPYLSDEDERFIDSTVRTFMTAHSVPGGSVALSLEGRLLFARTYGVADPGTNAPVTTGHLFRLASLSKPITSVAAFRLIEAGLLNLGDRVFGADALLGTGFGNAPYGPNIDQITVQHLLEHTSGWAASGDPMFGHLHLNQAQLIDHMLDNVPLATAPGARFDYLNFGYCVLGRVIEEVTGLTYDAAVRQHVLAPCGITDMHIAGDTLADRRANEVVYVQQGAFSPYGFRAGRMDAHGGWIASATDVVRFLVRVDGSSNKPDILTPASISTMMTPTTATTAGGVTTGYAKGWNTNAAGNRWHTGDFAGSITELIMSNSGFGWAALFNTRNDARLDQMRTDIDGLMWTIVGRITDWPSIDLF